MALYAADGSINITVVDGNSYVGRYAPNGSMNVVVTDGSTLTGLHHRSGAMHVVNTNSNVLSAQHPSGGIYVSDSTYANGSLRVTVVSGSLEGGGGGGGAGTLLFTIPFITQAA